MAHRLGLSVGGDAPAAGPRSASTRLVRPRRRALKTAKRSPASKRAASAGGGTANAAVVATQAQGPRPPRGSAGNGRAGSSRTSRRQQDVLRLVKERPGITVGEIAKELGVDATDLYRPVRKLEQDGAIIKLGVALQPTSG